MRASGTIRHMALFALVMIALLPLIAGAKFDTAQVAAQGGWYDVFVEQQPETGIARVHFVDAFSGLSTVVRTDNGQRFTLVGRYVMYEKRQSGAIMRAHPEGGLEAHPFVRRPVGGQGVYWVASPNGDALTWVIINEDGLSSAYAALADGRELRQLPISSPGPGLELRPLAITNDMGQVFYDQAQPAPGDDANPFTRYHHLMRYNIRQEAFIGVPGEPLCPCGAAVAANGGLLARLSTPDAAGVGPFGMQVWSLGMEAELDVPPADLPFTQAGDLLLNDTGTLAAYSAAGGPSGQYGLVVVEVVLGEQYLPFAPGEQRYRPVAFIDDDDALLLIAEPQGSTYKLNLETRELVMVSAFTYLGRIPQ